VNLGAELSSRLRAREQFAYVEPESEAQAQAMVRSGKLAFALVIPGGFSAQSIAGRRAGDAELRVLSSAGNHYEGALLAAQFAKALGEEINIALNTKRWALVLEESAKSSATLEQLAAGLAQLQYASAQMRQVLDDLAERLGATRQSSLQLYGGVDSLSRVYARAASGIRDAEATMPPPAEVRSVRLAAEGLSREQQELDREITALERLAGRLQGHAQGLRKELEPSQVHSELKESAFDPLQSDTEELQRRLDRSARMHQRLLEGSAELNASARELAMRIRDHRASLRSLAAAIPPEPAGASGLLQAGTSLNQGQVGLELAVTELRQKVVLLGAGVDALTSALPPQGPPIVASAAGLAQSVVPQVELIAPVANHGSGMAPNIVPIGLWLGVGVAVFLVRPRTIALVLRPFARMPKLFGKLSIPALVACTQAVVLSLILMFVLDLKIANPLGFAACMMVSVLAFLSIVIALSTIWGDAGKALAMILLAIQMASSGGVLPVELSGSFYAQISPWLPMTWVVRGLKASMFGAYEGNWVTPLMLMLAVAAVFLMVAAYFGRWDYRPRRRIPPALDL